jgi:hypothetical protein
MPHYDGLSPYQRDQRIIALRKQGLSYRAIGRQVGLDGSSVLRALRRLQAGGRGTRAQG